MADNEGRWMNWGREVVMEEKEESRGEKVLMIFSLLLSQFFPPRAGNSWCSGGSPLALSPWLLLDLPARGLAAARDKCSPTEMSWGTARFDWEG